SRGNRIAVREVNFIGQAAPPAVPTLLTTVYGYDALDQLLTVTDAKGNVTSTVYDTVGQMVTLTSPDAGRTEYRYDLGGTLREKQTPVLRQQSRFIAYAYDPNSERLKTITYPSLPMVTYTYGTSTEGGDGNGNVAARIKTVTMEARQRDAAVR